VCGGGVELGWMAASTELVKQTWQEYLQSRLARWHVWRGRQ